MKRIRTLHPLFLMCLLLFGVTASFATGKDGAKDNVLDAVITQNTANRTLVNVGQVAMWIYASGQSSITPQGGSGLFFPRGSNPTTSAIFQDGLVWGGQVSDGQEPVIRVGGAQYNVGHVPGRILSQGVAEDRTDPSVNRIWRVRRDFLIADLRQDAAEVNNVRAAQVSEAQIEQLRDTYRQDWIDWPAASGAPFYDADGDGQYTPAFNSDGTPRLAPRGDQEYDPEVHADEPGIADADQVVWLVSNDLDRATLSNFSGAPPIGIEQQITLWAYARADALGQIIFKQFRLIYKGDTNTPSTARVDSMYICQWSDPDVGSSGDDLAGSDTTLSLGYAYNSNAQDAVYASAGLPPPASGYDFFAGPLVRDADGEAIFGLEKRPGWRNLPMTTFASFSAGSQASDPAPLGTFNVTLQWFNLLRGFLPRPESPATPFIDPTTGLATKFTLSGDPIANTGWVDQGSGDRRILLSSGPFTMALGDTQETVVATLAAIATDRLSSVALLKFVDRFAQEAFDNLFELPKPPATPVAFASELDGQIILNWGGDETAVSATEGHNDKGHLFEGYDIYQLPSAGATADQGVRIRTFDVVNDFTTISQEAFDIPSGLVLSLPVQFGSNSGIQRTTVLSADKIRGLKLVNGQTYFFGVSAYSNNPDPSATIKSLESTMAVVTVVPQTSKPGVRLQAAFGDTVSTIEHVNLAGGPLSDGKVLPIVSDPTAITGDDYSVSFREVIADIDLSDPEHPDTTTQIVWDLVNLTTGDTVLAAQANQSGDETYLTADGLQVKVLGAPLAIASAPGSQADGLVEVAADGQPLPESAWDGAGTPFGGNKVWHSLNAGGFSDRYYVSAGGGTGQLSRLARSVQNLVPFDLEMRFTTPEEGSLGWWAFTNGAVSAVPFQLWRTGIGTPDDPSDDIRLLPLIFSSGTDDAWDITYPDPWQSGAFLCTDWTYWYFDARGYDAFAADAADGIVDDGSFGTVEYIARMTVCDFDANGQVAGPGYVIRINTTKPNSLDDKFTFSTRQYVKTESQSVAKQDVSELVNVFPNPYLGVNRFEQNRFNRRVTFSHLPARATIRIFNLAGILVRTLRKDDAAQFMDWNLVNESGLPVASGLYIAHIEMPDLKASKNLKLAIIQEQQFLRRF
ncbi:MAG: T9SS type A sorting domain-containing protein [bacterium]